MTETRWMRYWSIFIPVALSWIALMLIFSAVTVLAIVAPDISIQQKFFPLVWSLGILAFLGWVGRLLWRYWPRKEMLDDAVQTRRN